MKKLMIGFLLANSLSAYADCKPNYESKITEMKERRWVFKPERGSSLIGSIGQALGATAVGVTAGGVAGFILPYALSGLTYAGVGVATPFVSMPLTSSAYVVSGFLSVGAEAAFPVLGTTFLVAPFTIWGDVMMKNWVYVPKMMKAAGNASKAMIGLTTSHFVPIAAIVGGAAGLTVGVHDAIINNKVRNLIKAKELIQYSEELLKGSEAARLKLAPLYKKLGKKIRQSMSLNELASYVDKLNQEKAFCEGKPMSFGKIKKLFKAGNVGEESEVAVVTEEELSQLAQLTTKIEMPEGTDENTVLFMKTLEEI